MAPHPDSSLDVEATPEGRALTAHLVTRRNAWKHVLSVGVVSALAALQTQRSTLTERLTFGLASFVAGCLMILAMALRPRYEAWRRRRVLREADALFSPSRARD